MTQASADDVKKALERARIWSSASAVQRAAILNKAADLFEENFGEIFAVLTREAGKVIPDASAELREAVDFLRYYAAQATTLAQDEGWARAASSLVSRLGIFLLRFSQARFPPHLPGVMLYWPSLLNPPPSLPQSL